MQGLGARLCCYWSAAGYALALMPALAVKQQTRYRFANSSLESDPAHSIMSGPELRCIVIKPPCVQGATCFELELVQEAAQGPHSESILEEDQQDHCEEDPAASRGSVDVQRVYQYHMLYQPSYQVPTMAIRGSASGDACRFMHLALVSCAQATCNP